MSMISASKFIFLSPTPPAPKLAYISKPPKCFLPSIYHSSKKTLSLVFSKSFEAEEEEEDLSSTEDEWFKKLPEKNKPLYSHSLPCIEAWLRSLGFYRSKDNRSVWSIEKSDWHAQLSLDITDLYIR